MGNRGSKSDFIIKSVKEQRVDGSYFGFIPRLRCTLMGGESCYLINILSKQLNYIYIFLLYIFFSSFLFFKNKLNTWFVTGFTDLLLAFVYTSTRMPAVITTARVLASEFLFVDIPGTRWQAKKKYEPLKHV